MYSTRTPLKTDTLSVLTITVTLPSSCSRHACFDGTTRLFLTSMLSPSCSSYPYISLVTFWSWKRVGLSFLGWFFSFAGSMKITVDGSWKKLLQETGPLTHSHLCSIWVHAPSAIMLYAFPIPKPIPQAACAFGSQKQTIIPFHCQQMALIYVISHCL